MSKSRNYRCIIRRWSWITTNDLRESIYTWTHRLSLRSKQPWQMLALASRRATILQKKRYWAGLANRPNPWTSDSAPHSVCHLLARPDSGSEWINESNIDETGILKSNLIRFRKFQEMFANVGKKTLQISRIVSFPGDCREFRRRFIKFDQTGRICWSNEK